MKQVSADVGRAGDEIFHQMAKWQSMSGGVLRMPLVLRCSIGNRGWDSLDLARMGL